MIAVYEEENLEPSVLLFGGTSANKSNQWTRRLKPTDFVLQGAALAPAGLSNPMAIQFEAGAIATLPWNDTYFLCVNPKRTPIMGHIDVTSEPLKTTFRKAGTAAGLRSLFEIEQARVQALTVPVAATKSKS